MNNEKASAINTAPILTDYQYIFTYRILKIITSNITRKDYLKKRKSFPQPNSYQATGKKLMHNQKASTTITIPFFTDYHYIFTDRIPKIILSNINGKDIQKKRESFPQPNSYEALRANR